VKLNFLDLPVCNGYEACSTRPPQRTSSVSSINFLLMSAIDRMRNQENEQTEKYKLVGAPTLCWRWTRHEKVLTVTDPFQQLRVTKQPSHKNAQ